MPIIETIQSSFWWINILLVILVIFLGRKKDPRSTLIWIMALAIFPVVGFLFYILIGQDFRKGKLFTLKKEMDEAINANAKNQNQQIRDNTFPFIDPNVRRYRELIIQNLNADAAYYSETNEAELFFWGNKKFERLLQDIRDAKWSIDMQYYIFKSDEIGLQVIEALTKKAQEGVKVRLLLDGVGGRFVRREHLRGFREAGGQVAIFFPSMFETINFRMNYRNHRKLVIIDDQIGYIGGFNVGDEYLGKKKRMGPWRDTHLRIDGSAVAGLKLRFVKDWLYASGDNPTKEPDVITIPNRRGTIGMQLITSGPDTEYKNIKYAMIRMINDAKNKIYIQTPYLVPDASMMDALITKLISGVEINIMIPNKPDHPVIYWATTSFAGELLRYGANIYIYNRGFLHAKVMIVDETISMVGSANMDERSFSLNFEASEIIFDKGINRQLREQFDVDISDSIFLTPEMYAKRSIFQRIKEPVSRLFSPLL